MSFETHNTNPRVLKNTVLGKSEQHQGYDVKEPLWREWDIWDFSGVFHTGKVNLKWKADSKVSFAQAYVTLTFPSRVFDLI